MHTVNDDNYWTQMCPRSSLLPELKAMELPLPHNGNRKRKGTKTLIKEKDILGKP